MEKYLQRDGAICLDDDAMPYPRLCAHRGFNAVAPENSMPAYGAAVALGANEIECDLWLSKDGTIVSCHDYVLERVSDGTGKVYNYTYEELLQFDFGVKRGEEFTGIRIPTFEDILKKFARQTIINIHVKIWDVADWEYMLNEYAAEGLDLRAREDEFMQKIVELIRKYGAEKYVYFMSNSDRMLEKVKKYAPEIKICVGQIYTTKEPRKIVDRAIRLNAEKLQFLAGYEFDETDVARAHEHGILCNFCAVDDENKLEKYLDMGVDTILTNRFQRILCEFKKIIAKKGKYME